MSPAIRHPDSPCLRASVANVQPDFQLRAQDGASQCRRRVEPGGSVSNRHSCRLETHLNPCAPMKSLLLIVTQSPLFCAQIPTTSRGIPNRNIPVLEFSQPAQNTDACKFLIATRQRMLPWGPMHILDTLKSRARAYPQRIVLPEGEDDRIIQAAARAAAEGYAKPTLLGRTDAIRASAARLGAKLDGIEILDPASSPRVDSYAQIYLERRRARATALEDAREPARKPLYFAALRVAAGEADGSVGGAANSTPDTVRAALHSIGLEPDARLVSSFFLMIAPARDAAAFGEKGALLFADCGVVPDPSAQDLADIAIATADNARAFLEVDPPGAVCSL